MKKQLINDLNNVSNNDDDDDDHHHHYQVGVRSYPRDFSDVQKKDNFIN